MSVADIVILVIIVMALGVAGYFAFSGRGHGSCCDNDSNNNKKNTCDGNCANCHRH